MGLYQWINDNATTKPVQLEMHIDKIDRNRDIRYMKVMIDGYDVTQMVADAANLKMSKARDSYDDLIVRGSGMDMCFYVQDRLYHHACQDGHPDLIDPHSYKFIDDVEAHKKMWKEKREAQKEEPEALYADEAENEEIEL